MSLSSLATASDRTITQSSTPLESSLEFSAATTACDTFSGDRKDKPSHFDANEFRRRPFKRLPIPPALISPTKVEAEADFVGVRLGYGLPTPYQEEREEDGEERFPESPGNSPLSQFQQSHQLEDKERRRCSLSPPALRTKHWRNRSEPEAAPGKQLYPSPPRLEFEIQPEDLIPAAKRKVLKRKPIPQSLFVRASAEEKQRSWSVPDIFRGTLFDEDRGKPDIESSNQLGLFFPSTVDSQQQVTGVTPSSLFNTEANRTESQTQTQTQRQLRRSTRSISESLPRPRLPFAVAATHDLRKVRLGVHAGGSPDSTELEQSPLSSGGSDSSDAWEERQPSRGRTRSGSAPVYTTGQGLGGEGGIEQRHILRRVSRRQEGEMRSVYLSRPSPSASPSGAHYKALPTSMFDHPNSVFAETEGIEVLRTPDPPSQSSFASSLTHQHNHNMSSSSSSIYDSLRSGSWDDTLAASHHHNHNRGRSSSESSMASLLVLQQHIQQRNHLRQFAPPGIADPHLPPDFQRRLSRQESSPAADMAGAMAREDSERSAGGMVGQFGALRIKNFALEDDDNQEEEQFQLPYLSSLESSDLNEEAAAVAGSGDGGSGLRHMFSNPLLPSTHFREDSSPPTSLGSLRERRAKPPIRIALAPTTNSVPQLRKKASKSHVLSPTTTVHSPPPHPPPTTPLPDLPAPPGSAPLLATTAARGGGKQQQRLLLMKRSWTRSSSSPVSPNVVVTAQRRHRNHHGLTQSQGDIPAPLPTATSAGVDDGCEGSATPVTAGLPALVHDGQPDTPLTATTEGAITPVRPTAGKFDGLLAFLSSKTRNSKDEGGRDSPRAKKPLSNHRHSGEELPTSSSAGPIVYGLAL